MRSICQPLDDLKDSEWTWSASCQQAFESTKGILNSDFLLTHYDPSLEVIVMADASEHGVGAVIQHRWLDGLVKAIAHASSSLKPAEHYYSQIEKEGLALIFTARKFHEYIYGISHSSRIIDPSCRYLGTARAFQFIQRIAYNAGQQPSLAMTLGLSTGNQRILVRPTHSLV